MIEILIKHSSIRFLGRVDDEQWEVKTVLGDAVHGGVRYFTVRLKD
jgi:predicted aconitase with swiveling domain